MRLNQLREFKLFKPKEFKWNYLALAFFIPFIMIFLLMIAVGIVPFGSKSFLYSDCFHQYYPFFKAFRKALLSGESLLYSWNVGMGMDYLGLIAYYLASPLNLLSVLLPESWVLPYFQMLWPVKLGLASLFFAVFLKNAFGKDDLSIAVFGSFYGLCAWALGYQWNIMWLDTFALLPLVVLGTLRLLRDKKFILYTVSLALSIAINYYIGFFVCIFVLLIFICYQICSCKSMKNFFLDLCRIALFSILAIGLTAFLTLPAYAALQHTCSTENTFPDTFLLNIVEGKYYADAYQTWEEFKAAQEAGESAIGLWFSALGQSFVPLFIGMGQVAGNLSGGLSPTFMEGLPNIYSGVSILMLSFLFLMARNIKIREKLCAIFLLMFFMLSFVLRQLDFIWHGFHFTNQIPYRFSFLVSFVSLYMAYRAYLVRHRFRGIHFILAGLLTLEIFFLSSAMMSIPNALTALPEVLHQLGALISCTIAGDQAGTQAAATSVKSLYNIHGDAYIFLVYNFVFFFLTIMLLVYPKIHKPAHGEITEQKRRDLVILRANKHRISTALLSVVMVLELVMNVINFRLSFAYTDIKEYPWGTENAADVISNMKQNDDSLFYRTETTQAQILNDGAINDFNGISTFTSSANAKVTEFMDAMGFSAYYTWNRYEYEDGSPVADLFLNLKYTINRNSYIKEYPYYQKAYQSGNVTLLENNAYLPLGFLAEKGLGELEWLTKSTNSFANQNDLFGAATGIEDPVWRFLPDNWLEIRGIGVDILTQHSMGYCTYKKTENNASLTFKYNVEEDGYMALDVHLQPADYVHVYLNGSYLYSEHITLGHFLSVGQVRSGDEVELRANCNTTDMSTYSVHAVMLDDAVFRQGYELLSQSTMELTEFSTTRLVGKIYCNRDGFLYTSIPDDGNWHATVDGKEVEMVAVGGAMLGIPITEGEHEIIFTYVNKDFQLGVLISGICLLAFLALIYFKHHVMIHAKVLKLYRKVFKK